MEQKGNKQLSSKSEQLSLDSLSCIVINKILIFSLLKRIAYIGSLLSEDSVTMTTEVGL